MAKMRRDAAHRREIRHKRVRSKVVGSAARPRLCVYRSRSHMSAQIIDDGTGTTLVAASSVEQALRAEASGNKVAAAKVGAELGRRATAKGITAVVFDRGGVQYHGRVAAFAEAAREAGLEF